MKTSKLIKMLFFVIIIYTISIKSSISIEIPTLKSLTTNTKDVIISTTESTNAKQTLKTLALDDKDAKKTEIKIQNNIKESKDGKTITEQKIIVNGKETATNVFEGVSKTSNNQQNNDVKNKKDKNDNKNTQKVNFTKEVKGNDIYLTMDKKIEVSKDTTIKAEQLKLKEGDKNIYINFSPEIKVSGGNCSGIVVNAGNKPTNNNTIKKIAKITSKKKTNKNKVVAYANKKKKTKIQSMKSFLDKQDKDEVKIDLNKKKDNGSLYALDCIGGCQTDMYNSSIVNNKQTTKTIIKEVRKDEPIYVINRVIQVDEDTVLTEEKIEELVKGRGGIVSVQQIGGEQKHQARIGMYKTSEGLKSAYIGQIVNYRDEEDIVDKTNEAYGEIAFIDTDEYD